MAYRYIEHHYTTATLDHYYSAMQLKAVQTTQRKLYKFIHFLYFCFHAEVAVHHRVLNFVFCI